MEKEIYLDKTDGFSEEETPINPERESKEIIEEIVETVEEEVKPQDNGRDTSGGSDLSSFTSAINSDIDFQEEKHTRVWEPIISKKEHESLQEEYHKISPKGVLFFDVADQERFRQEARKNYESLHSRFNIEVIKRWDENEMDRMFGKGLNPTSLITSLESAQWFEKNLEDRSGIVMELGPGSGWSTIMLFNTLREGTPDSKVKVMSVDMSAHAVAASQTLLEYSHIPYITISSSEELSSLTKWLESTEQGKNFSGVILVLDEFEDVIKDLPDSYISGAYSSHGSSYLSESEYITVLELLQNKLKPSGIFIADSLNPLYTNKLHKLLTIGQMVAPNFIQRILDKKNVKYIEKKNTKLKSNSKYFQGQDVTILEGFNTPHAYLIFRWCNFLIRSGQIKRLLDTKKSLEVTMEVVEAYRDDVYPSYLLEGMIKENGFKYSKLDGRPDFPIFMDTQGFRLTK